MLSTKTEPFVGSYKFKSSFAKVDFPEPIFPMIPTFSPFLIVRFIFFKTSNFCSLYAKFTSLKTISPSKFGLLRYY